MNKKNIIKAITVSLLGVSLLASNKIVKAENNNDTNKVWTIGSVTIKVDRASLPSKVNIGESGKIVKIYDDGSVDKMKSDVSFESSNPEILQVDKYGNWTALKSGKVKVFFNYNQELDKDELDKFGYTLPEGIKDIGRVTEPIEVDVVDPNSNNNKVWSQSAVTVTIDRKSLPSEVKVGESGKISKLYEDGSVDKMVSDVSFSSSNPEILQVDKYGNWSALKAGDVEVSFRYNPILEEDEMKKFGYTSADESEIKRITEPISVKVVDVNGNNSSLNTNIKVDNTQNNSLNNNKKVVQNNLSQNVSNNSKISTMKINKSIPKTLDSINIIPYIGSLIISCFALILKRRIK